MIATALLLAFAVQALAVKPYRIPSPSMEPTLDVGQRVLVNRIPRHLGAHPGVGDIVVFRPPAGADTETCGAPDQGDGTSTPCDKDLPAGARTTPTSSAWSAWRATGSRSAADT